MTAAADEITAAARAWLDGLDASQREAAVFPFDTNERFVWAYTPGTREGLALRDMRPDQRSAATAILGASLSERTAGEIATIIALETILGALERERRPQRLDAARSRAVLVRRVRRARRT